MAEAALQETILGSGAGGPLTPPGPWVQYAGYLTYSGGIILGNATDGNKGVGTVNAKDFYKDGVKIDLGLYLPLTGGVMTGLISLSGPPTASMHPTTKQYVDQATGNISGSLANYLLLAGGTMTGFLTLSAEPTADLHASTKKYVDDKLAGIIGIADAPSDGINYGRKNAAWADVSLIDVGTY
jgi:hypothetical protein